MKKSLLILCTVLGLAASASAQGFMYISTPATAGFNSVTSNPLDSGPSGTYADFYTGTLKLEIFSIPYSPIAANEAAVINNDAGSVTSIIIAINLLSTDGFTQQTIGGSNSATFNIDLSWFSVNWKNGI